MPAPTNTTPGTAIDLLTLPASVTQQVDDSGTTYTVWYKYTAPADSVVNLWGYGDPSVYRPTVQIFLSPGTTTQYMGISCVPSAGKLTAPAQFPVRAGETYLLKFITNSPSVSPAILTISMLDFTPAIVPIEAIAINDDAGEVNRGDGATDTFPLTLLSTGADYAPLAYVPSFPSGETGDCLADGTSLVGNDDEFSPPLSLIGFDSQFNQLFSNVLTANSLRDIKGNRTQGKFYVLIYDASSPFHPKVVRVSPAGTIEATSSSIANTTNAVISMDTSPDGTIAYYAFFANPTSKIGRWDLINDVAMSDLVTGITPFNLFHFSGLLCLDDGSVILGIRGGSGEIRRYNSSGSLLNTYTAASLGVPNFASDPLNGDDCRLAHGIVDTSFWFRGRYIDSNGFAIGYFLKIEAATGTVLLRVLDTDYTSGVNSSKVASSANLLARFGFSNSCTFWILPVAPAGDEGEILVEKIGVSSTPGATFNFTTVNLTPGSFILTPGDNQSFPGLTPGDGYEVTETPNPDYLTSYTSSNGSPHDNLVVTTSQTTILYVTNEFMNGSGDILVKKIAVSTSALDNFSFTTVGLTPGTFILTPGDQQLFSGLGAGGGYQVVEVDNPNYSVSYTTSNGSFNTNLVVTTNTTTILYVTNTFIGPRSGIYFIHPGKTNDTVFDTITITSSTSAPVFTTLVVKIPNPFIVC